MCYSEPAQLFNTMLQKIVCYRGLHADAQCLNYSVYRKLFKHLHPSPIQNAKKWHEEGLDVISLLEFHLSMALL